jgi:hypothetical protein
MPRTYIFPILVHISVDDAVISRVTPRCILLNNPLNARWENLYLSLLRIFSDDLHFVLADYCFKHLLCFYHVFLATYLPKVILIRFEISSIKVIRVITQVP